MFDPEALEHTLKLHRQSYALLRWTNEAVKEGALKFSFAHRVLSIPDAAEEWMTRHRDQIPYELRPEREDIPALSHLFASFLTSSFEIKERPGVKLGPDRCTCGWCAYWLPGDHLQPKKLTENAPKLAYYLKQLYLQRLTKEIGVPETKAELLLKDKEAADALTLATYADDLMNRTHAAGRGEGVLYLWRRLAWTKTEQKKNFKLSHKSILAAEKLLVKKLVEP